MSLKEFLYFHKMKIIFFSLIVILVLFGIGFYYFHYISDNNDNIVIDVENEFELLETDKEEDLVQLCVFDIKGEVKNPGVYSIECDKRINDAIILSGGITKNGDTSVLNLSKKIEDGIVIIVYSKKEISDYLNTLKKEEQKISICNNSSLQNDACINNSNNSNNSISSNNGQSSGVSSKLININTASLNELMELSGIGETKAKNIISYREKTPFKQIQDILNVDGIGESIYVNIKENITV